MRGMVPRVQIMQGMVPRVHGTQGMMSGEEGWVQRQKAWDSLGEIARERRVLMGRGR